jgi:hypothetical protein
MRRPSKNTYVVSHVKKKIKQVIFVSGIISVISKIRHIGSKLGRIYGLIQKDPGATDIANLVVADLQYGILG